MVATVETALSKYRTQNAGLFERDPAFARWLEEAYEPIAGAWEY